MLSGRYHRALGDLHERRIYGDGGGVGLDGLLSVLVDDDGTAGLVERDVLQDQRAVGLVGQQRAFPDPPIGDGRGGGRGGNLQKHEYFLLKLLD